MGTRGKIIGLCIAALLTLCAANTTKPHEHHAVTNVRWTSVTPRIAHALRSDSRAQPLQMFRRSGRITLAHLATRPPGTKSLTSREGLSQLLSHAVIERLPLAEINAPGNDHRVTSTWLRI